MPAADNEPIFTPGKVLHILGGWACGFAAAALTERVSAPGVRTQFPLFLPAVALAGGQIAGMSKELLDATGFGDPRFTDVLITDIGGLAAAGCEALVRPPATASGRNGAALLFAAAAGVLAVPVVQGLATELIGDLRRTHSKAIARPAATK